MSVPRRFGRVDSCRRCGRALIAHESRVRGVCGSCDVNRSNWRRNALPHKDYLDKSIRDTMIQYWFQVGTHQGRSPGGKVREAIHSEFVKDVYWRPLAAFTFPPFPAAWWGRYLSKKVAFVESVNADGLSVDANSREKGS